MKVVDFLRENSLDELIAKYAINAKRHGHYKNLVLLKYDQIDSPKADPIVIECRGLILDEDNNWAVVSYPYNRFFNYGEGPAAEIDWSTAKVVDKLDGSIAVLYFYDGAWQVSTSGMPDAAGPVNQETGLTFAELFWRTFTNLGYNLPQQKSLCCYMFELMTPENRVVIPYDKPRLVLHGVRQLITDYPGFDYNELAPEPIAEENGWECVKSYPLQSFQEVVAAAAALNPMQNEGFIVCDGQFRRNKLKSPQYVAIAHMKDQFSERRMLELARLNEHEEWLQYFPEMREVFMKQKIKFDALVDEATSIYEKIKHIEVQKDFAIEAQKCRCSGALFAVRNKRFDSIRKYLAEIGISSLEKMI